jgi:hypothetical protein
MTREHLNEFITKSWLNKDGNLQGNFSRSEKTKEAIKYLIDYTYFLDANISLAIRFYYLKNNLLEPVKCLVCKKNITDKMPYRICAVLKSVGGIVHTNLK